MKWFVSSDIHGFFDEYMKALKEAGFRKDDSNHGIIVCGDIFDRGEKPLEVYEFLKSLPKERRILIRGNHEILLKELCKRKYPKQHDISNGTHQTLQDIAGVTGDALSDEISRIRKKVEKKYGIPSVYNNPTAYDEFCDKREEETKKYKEKLYNNSTIKKILEWIDSDEWVNYYELGNYIFVHSFIPISKDLNVDKSRWSGYLIYDNERYNENWREASQEDWDDAMWGCPWKQYEEGFFQPEEDKGKILVCGHWHASDFWNNLEYKDDIGKRINTYGDNPMFVSENYPHIIALDACTVVSHRVNVLVIDDADFTKAK